METIIRTCTEPNCRIRNFRGFTVRDDMPRCRKGWEPRNYYLCALLIDRSSCFDVDRFPQLRCRFCALLARIMMKCMVLCLWWCESSTERSSLAARAAGRITPGVGAGMLTERRRAGHS